MVYALKWVFFQGLCYNVINLNIGNNMLFLSILTIAIVTALTRFLPFFLFSRRVPNIIVRLGIILPPSLVAMVFVYSCKDILGNIILGYGNLIDGIYGLIGIIVVLLLHICFKNILLSIIGGTIFYLCLCNHQFFISLLN